MDTPDPRDQAFGIGATAVGGAGYELAGAAQAAKHVLAKVGVIPDAGQCQRVQGLQKQGGDSADQHRGEIAVDSPAHRVRAEQAGIARRGFEVDAAKGKAGEAEDLGFDTATEQFHGRRVLMMTRPAYRVRIQAGEPSM